MLRLTYRIGLSNQIIADNFSVDFDNLAKQKKIKYTIGSR